VNLAKNLGTVWELDPHTAAKHAILRRYLQAWLPILSRRSERVLYLDGFAGPGIYSEGEPGSPIIALRTAIGFTPRITADLLCLFIEADRARYESLQREVAKVALPSNIHVRIEHGKCNETMNAVLDTVDQEGQHLIPTFAFLDPFGFSHSPFSLIKRIVRHPRCEVLITFMYEEINRFLLQEDQPDNLDSLFGTSDWRTAARMEVPKQRKAFIHTLYKHQLEADAGIPFVRSFEMVNRGNRTDYFLFFGTKSVKGLMKMKEAMWKVDASSGLQFSDATNPDQTLFFTSEPNFGDVKAQLVRQFKGKTASIEEIEEYVLVHTPYRETHYKKQVLKPMEHSVPPGLAIRESPPGRKKGQFPAGTKMEFL
jgi:three-Cys-motif partner protein